MEDSHIVNTSLPNDVSIFGVFDGHGGAEVALYV
jgi:serine/threonine protein phosphatase PrpC